MSHRKRETPFSHCPGCGAPELTFNGVNRFACTRCGFVFFHNTAAGCAAILTLQDARDRVEKILLLRRARDPARGKLDLPGGFIDPGESVEEALTREIREETGLEVRDLGYFCSGPNRYEYRQVLYNTCDLVFTGTADPGGLRREESEVAALVLRRPEEIVLEEIAFPSLRSAMHRYLTALRERS